VKLTEVFAIRAEYRRYIFGESDWGVNAIIGAISLFFWVKPFHPWRNC